MTNHIFPACEAMASPTRAERDLCANALCSSSEIALMLRVVVEAVCSAPITALEFCLLQSPKFWRPPVAFLRQLHDEIARMGLDQSVLQKNQIGRAHV